MARSTKKPFFTDQQTNSPGPLGRVARAKRAANKTVRRSEDVPSGKAYRKFYCSWDIRDWSFHCPTDKKAYRK